MTQIPSTYKWRYVDKVTFGRYKINSQKCHKYGV